MACSFLWEKPEWRFAKFVRLQLRVLRINALLSIFIWWQLIYRQFMHEDRTMVVMWKELPHCILKVSNHVNWCKKKTVRTSISSLFIVDVPKNMRCWKCNLFQKIIKGIELNVFLNEKSTFQQLNWQIHLKLLFSRVINFIYFSFNLIFITYFVGAFADY